MTVNSLDGPEGDLEGAKARSRGHNLAKPRARGYSVEMVGSASIGMTPRAIMPRLCAAA